MYTVGIITISDKGAAGQREDKSGPKIKELLPKDKYDVVSYKIIPDEREQIADELVRLCDAVKCNLVLTTGGTVFHREISHRKLQWMLQSVMHRVSLRH